MKRMCDKSLVILVSKCRGKGRSDLAYLERWALADVIYVIIPT